METGMKLLVTGGAGFIGSAVVRQAVAAGHAVVNLDVLAYSANLANVASGGKPEVDQAVDAARRAFPAWAALGPEGRLPYLKRFAEMEKAITKMKSTGEYLSNLVDQWANASN